MTAIAAPNVLTLATADGMVSPRLANVTSAHPTRPGDYRGRIDCLQTRVLRRAPRRERSQRRLPAVLTVHGLPVHPNWHVRRGGLWGGRAADCREAQPRAYAGYWAGLLALARRPAQSPLAARTGWASVRHDIPVWFHLQWALGGVYAGGAWPTPCHLIQALEQTLHSLAAFRRSVVSSGDAYMLISS